MNTNKKTIGIIGGMGPEGTADLYMKIVKYYQTNFNAKYDKDFPAFIIYSAPVPDVVESLENEETTLKMLSKAAQVLEGDGCDFIVIACNTVQFLLEKIRSSVSIPIMGIAEVNAEFAKKKGYKKVGILATQATIEKKVYGNEFDKNNIEIVKPSSEDQDKVTRVIMAQLAGKAANTERQILIEIAGRLKEQGAQTVLIACTDLPPIIKQSDVDIPLIDCTEIYANEAAKLSAS